MRAFPLIMRERGYVIGDTPGSQASWLKRSPQWRRWPYAARALGRIPHRHPWPWRSWLRKPACASGVREPLSLFALGLVEKQRLPSSGH